MKNLMIWCTCAEDNKLFYLKRVVKWYQQAEAVFGKFNPDFYCFVDGEITNEDINNISEKLLNINFINIIPKLGRKNIFEFPGWKRSFKTALETGREYNYIIHIENDLKIINAEKIASYTFKSGYYIGRNKDYDILDTTLMILNDKDLNEKIIQYYSSFQNLNQSNFFEYTFQEIVKDNIHQDFIPVQDYIHQYNVLQNQQNQKINEYHIFSVLTPDLFMLVKTLANNLKKYKKENSNYIYHIFLCDDNIELYKNNLSYLISDDFKLDIQSFNHYQNIIKPATNNKHWSAYGKCLACQLFPDLDKILYLDVDLFVINRGLEEFMDDDITNYYVKGCCNVHVLYNDKNEIENSKNNDYIDTGVMMLNLKKIRQDRIDKEIKNAITGNWPTELKPTYNEHSLLNYYLRDKILLSRPKFNNSLITILENDLSAYTDYYGKWGHSNVFESVSSAIIIHYANIKPWKNQDFERYIQFLVFSQMFLFIFNYFLFKE